MSAVALKLQMLNTVLDRKDKDFVLLMTVIGGCLKTTKNMHMNEYEYE